MKIMILGAGIYQEPLIKEAVKNCKVILVAPVISDELKRIVHKFYFVDVRNEKEILEIAQKEQINGIITDQTDIPVRTVAYVTEKLNLSGIGYECAKLFTNKVLMRERLKELGLPVLPYIETSILKDAVSFFIEKGLKSAILKPIDNQGSRGVFEIRNVEELEKYFNKTLSYSKEGKVLLEKKVTGKEFFIEAMSFDYKYSPLICGDTKYFNIKNVFAANARIAPSQADSRIVARILELNEKIITGFGLKQGISHSEFIFDGDEIYLIETAARGGGVFISSDLVSLATGLKTEQFLLNIALGLQKNMPQIKRKSDCVCAYLAFFIPTGKIISIEGLEIVKNLPYVHRNLLHTLKVGMEVKMTLDKTSRIAIVIDAKSIQELQDRIDFIKQTLKITVESKGKLLDIIWE